MRTLWRPAALAALAAAGSAVGLLALSHGTTGAVQGPGAPPLIAAASLDPGTPGFGDRISATIAVELDRRRARAQTLRISYDLAPLRPIGPPRTIRAVRGDVELDTISVPVACISEACLAKSGVAQIRLAPARIRVATPTGLRRASVDWPVLSVRDRVLAADVAAAQPPLQADASPLAPTYDVSPATLASVLDIFAIRMGVGAVALGAWELELLARRRRRRPEAALVRAIRLARSAQTLPGPERRRALERLARVLGRGALQTEATRLAWSEETPEPAAVERFVTAVEREEAE